MNDTASLLLATTILGIGGLGLFMYKSTDDKSRYEHNKYDEEETDEPSEDSFFGLGKFWSANEEEPENDAEIQEEVEIYEPKVRSKGSKTKRNRKTTGSKRRY